ncbi:septum formation initiator family protein [Candidatus Saccharibacteria bacterium]|nr:septum formation initiator family protein [Candidatus Saccharibacteria bacterium]MBI3337702.1 septum formation initiator family protein [Candidatus Saccharibacteria bacterium]
MLKKIKNYYKSPIWQQIRDVRFLGFMVFGVLVLLVSWSSVGIIQTNYDLQKQISKLEQQNTIQELENNNLKLRNEYYNTDQYLELATRRQFGKAVPGEKLVLVPRGVALAHTIDLPDPNKKIVDKPKPKKPLYQKNFEAWMNFFMHRQE